jgi:hypothetical protein
MPILLSLTPIRLKINLQLNILMLNPQKAQVCFDKTKK